ncbi:MAG: chemotaxis response regulator protein-glutamate methylesterase [Pseudomonadales bacterium]|nr:chemotaxis response regulator protein-glutamate methylesterase [Pseudomonadales bacterium]
MSIKVMLVDDSAVVRKILSEILEKAPGIEVIAVAQDPIFAMKKLETVRPDVMILDIEMPRMDGLTYLKKIMAEDPIPVVICSTLTQKASKTSIEALRLGAVEVVAKPTSNIGNRLGDSAKLIIDAVKAASQANLKRVKQLSAGQASSAKTNEKLSACAVLPRSPGGLQSTDKLVAIGTSTGGTLALEDILSRLPADSPPIVVVQHMPAAFTSAFASRLDSVSQVRVQEANDGDLVEPGKVIIAAGGKHMMVECKAGVQKIVVKEGPLVSRHRPSVDVLFRSVAQNVGKNALGIIMTGMGDDGANGLKEMRVAGGRTLAQDEASCVIYGMPAVAVERGAVEREITLQGIPTAITSFAR